MNFMVHFQVTGNMGNMDASEALLLTTLSLYLLTNYTTQQKIILTPGFEIVRF